MKPSKAFKIYAPSYAVKVLNSQDPRSQLNITEPHVKSLLKNLLAEMKGFKYQITL